MKQLLKWKHLHKKETKGSDASYRQPTINPKPPPILMPCILIYAPFLIITYKITPSNAMQRTMDPFIFLEIQKCKVFMPSHTG